MNRKPRTVLLLIETLNRGGIENVLLRLLPKLQKEGWMSVVVTIRDGGEMLPEYKHAGIQVVTLNQKQVFSLTTVKTIAACVRKINPDIVVTTLFKADVIGRLYLRFVLRQPVIPYLVTTYNHRRYWIARVFEWITKPLASRYIANSDAVQTFYEKHLGVKSGKIVVAPNGVDTDVFQAAQAGDLSRDLKLPQNAFVVTCVANLAPNKGQSDLLVAFEQAFANDSTAYLLLVGDGGERESLKLQRENLTAKERIILMGRRTDVPAILKLTTVFALPTLFEGMSTAILEAMAAGKAIVTTNIPENKILIAENKNGLLITPKDQNQLAKALKLLYDNPELRERLGVAAFASVTKRYSITNMAQAFVAIFNTLIPLRPKKDRVIHIINSLEVGGAENMLLKTLPLLDKEEFEQIVITLFKPGELAPQFKKRGIKVIHSKLNGLLDLSGLRRLVQEIKKQNPTIIITYLFHASFIGRVYIQQRTHLPVIPFLRSTYNFPRYWSARIFERVTKAWVPQYFANSEAVKDYYVKNMGVSPDKISIIHNGIDTTLYQQANGARIVKELALPNSRIVISCVANLAVNKGHSFLLQAFEGIYSQYPESWLLLIGEGQERDNLERQVENYTSKSNIKFLGRRTDVPEILALTDIFVLPTLFEGLSNAILEAMAAECAVITTDIPENKIMIENNETGLLIPTQNVPALERALVDLLENKRRRQKLGRNAKKFIQEKFDLHRVARDLDEAIRLQAYR